MRINYILKGTRDGVSHMFIGEHSIDLEAIQMRQIPGKTSFAVFAPGGFYYESKYSSQARGVFYSLQGLMAFGKVNSLVPSVGHIQAMGPSEVLAFQNPLPTIPEDPEYSSDDDAVHSV